MIDPKRLLVLVGPQHLAKGLERGFQELDTYIIGSPIQPSLAANLGGAALGMLGSLFVGSPWDEILAIMGGHMSTKLWDYVEAMIPPPAATRLRYVQGGVSAGGTQTLIPSTGAYVPRRPGLTQDIRYAPEQRVVTSPKFIPGVLRPKFQLGN
jgi:hypothetical protein